jgi:hypothetical protein
MRSRPYRAVDAWLCAAAFVVAALLATSARADDPLYGVAAASAAPYAKIATYEVTGSNEQSFLHAMVQSGAFHGREAAFANETIAQALPGSNQPVTFFSMSRYHDTKAGDRVETLRTNAVAPFVAREPGYIHAAVVEHLIPNWGWARNGKVTFRQVIPGAEGHTFDNYDTTLTYFKSGYTGMVSILELYKPGTDLDQVRADLTSRRGMAGATIFQDQANGRYLAYSEYFDAGETVARKSTLAERHVAVVVQNYKAR